MRNSSACGILFTCTYRVFVGSDRLCLVYLPCSAVPLVTLSLSFLVLPNHWMRGRHRSTPASSSRIDAPFVLMGGGWQFQARHRFLPPPSLLSGFYSPLHAPSPSHQATEARVPVPTECLFHFFLFLFDFEAIHMTRIQRQIVINLKWQTVDQIHCFPVKMIL